jgi:hypothetical protein
MASALIIFIALLTAAGAALAGSDVAGSAASPISRSARIRGIESPFIEV